PYARHEEYATIDAITRDDLIAFHKKYYHPNNVSLALWGDFDSDAIVKKVEKAFKGWQKQEIDFPAMPKVDMTYKNSVNLALKEDANQAPIIMGHVGIKLDDPDYFPILVMNRVLGQGGFSSRLVKEVRTRLGLAYATGGGINAQWEYPGTFTCFSLTRTENVMQAIEAIRTEIRRMTEEPITAEELQQAKESYLNSFVFNFDTRSEVIGRIMTYDYYGFPDDFLQQTKAGVEKVTVDDVLRVAKKHLHPDELHLLVVGNPETFDEPLDKLGKVNMIDISIPEPGDEQVSEATAEDLSKGKEVMMMAVDALGGADANNAVKNYNSKSNIVLNTPQGKFDIKANVTTVLPNKVAAILNLPFGEMRQVFDGENGFMASPQGTQDMPSADKEDTMKQMFRDLVGLVQGISSGDYEVQYLGTEQVDGADADVVMVSNGDYSTKLYLDAASHMPVKQSYRGKTMMGPAAMEEMYSMWKPIEGVMFPFKTVTMADGEEFTVARVTAVEVNGTVDESMFDKP
ncbi:MAG: hypothetical protein HKN21_05190, partial [Candidatus Eisenbacteria bacterium]|nr:hypothetical protein [Candidatus Eisenbacteria bacterium]